MTCFENNPNTSRAIENDNMMRNFPVNNKECVL